MQHSSIFLLLLLIISACGSIENNQKKDDLPANQEFTLDSVRISSIDNICDEIRKNMPSGSDPIIIDSSLVDADYTVEYFDWPDKNSTLSMVSGELESDIDYKYIFLKDGQPARLHWRYWKKELPDRKTVELFVYYDENGDIFYASERSAELEEGEIPAILKGIPLTTTKRSKEELDNMFSSYLNVVKKAIAKDRALRDTDQH